MVTARTIAGAQRARLKRTLLAAGGGAVLSIVVWLLFLRGVTWLDANELWVMMTLFWLINLGFILAIISNLNLRLSEPSMTLAQMLWATVSTFIFAYFVHDGRLLLLMIYLLSMTFGSFRLNLTEHFLVTLTALGSYAVVITCSAQLHPESFHGLAEILNWSVFLLVMVGFSILGGETSRLRDALVRGNRELRQARDATAIASEAKSRFLASTSHELRTPLNMMLGATDILDAAQLEREHRDALDRARYAGKHLLSLVNTMIDLSRIESGVLVLRSQPMSLVDELKSIHAMIMPVAQRHDVDFTLEISQLSDAPVIGDAMRIQEVLAHLLKLLITAPQTRTVSLRAKQLARADMVRFSVASAGAIVDHDAAQTDQDTDDAIGYESFSFDLCEMVIAVMGGELSKLGTPGQQARFEFEVNLPQVEVSTTASKSSAAIDSGATTAQALQRRKMLIVDDSTDNRLLLQAYLKDQPWDLRFAEDGLVAVAEAQQQTFDIILMDMHMPRMNGIDATRTIRKIESERPHQPAAWIIAITADDSVNDRQRSTEAGCDEHLVKPVSKSTLLQNIATM